MKEMAGKLVANLQAMGAASAPDDVVKASLANFGAESFEIACYKSLIAAAQAIGEQEVVRVCQQNLAEEQEMASWLNANIDRVTTEYLGKIATAR